MNTVKLTSADIEQMDSRYRAAFANSLTGYKSANLVGSRSPDGQDNLAIMSSAVHLGSHPPLIALVIRPDSVERHSLRNILATEHYTLNHVSADFVDAAHQTAARYPEDMSEFDATGLQPEWIDEFPVPFVKAASLKLGLRLREHHHLAINDTNLVIGEVEIAIVPESAIREDGSLRFAQLDSLALSGLDSYYRTEPVARMAYAKPDLAPRRLND